MPASPCVWLGSRSAPTLTPADIHVWFAQLEGKETPTGALWEFLTEDERVRASRFHFEVHRRRYVAARGILRLLLAEYSGQPAAAQRFSYSEFGKPTLLQDSNTPQVCFNIAHSGAAALYAVALETPLGVDLEQTRPMPDAMDIASRFFSPEEAAVMAELDPDVQQAAFFNGWTRKEAFIKAIGEGLSYPLESFDVTLRPGDAARVVQIEGSAQEADRWQLWDLRPADTYVGALAVRGRDWNLTSLCWQAP